MDYDKVYKFLKNYNIMQIEESDSDFLKSGKNFLGILNDIKRRPEDAANELQIPIDEINLIIRGKKPISKEIIEKAIKIWPVNERDFYIIKDDCINGVKIMNSVESEKSSRIMNRAGKPYYEYRDTVMSTVAPFRPEWISELCFVDDNSTENPNVQWNNGHFMHQFTYFIGEVNFYYIDENGEKNVAIMNTGDSMYITPFTPHTFTTRKNAKSRGLILALTYGGKLTGDVQQELSGLSVELGSQYALDFSSKKAALSSLLKFHLDNANFSLDELSKRTEISKEELVSYKNQIKEPSITTIEKIALALTINVRDIIPNDLIEKKVIIKEHKDCKSWSFPENSKTYQLYELVSTSALPYSKAFEVIVKDSDDSEFDLDSGLHQYVYNIGDSSIIMNWEYANSSFQKEINPNDSVYIKPFVKHNFRGNGKLLILRIGGKITGDSQRELSIVGKKNTERAISETMQWFNPKGKN